MNGLTGTVAQLYNAFEPDLKVSSKHSKTFVLSQDFYHEIKNFSGLNAISITLQDKAC